MSGERPKAHASDVIVVGLGAVGAATLYHLSKAGVKVLGIDRYHPPHDQGSSHGETRATRLAVGEGDVFVPLVHRSHELWRELEERSGECLLDACGFLTIDTTNGKSSLHGLPGFFERTVDIAQRWGIKHEIFDGEEVRRRFPAFEAPPEARGYYEAGGGMVFPERCVDTQIRLAEADGAKVVFDEQVLAIEAAGQSVSVTTEKGRYEAAKVVVAAGAWTPHVMGPEFGNLRILRQVLHWYRPERPGLYSAGAVPVFLWLHGPDASDIFYGFPSQGRDGRVKIATEQHQTVTTDADALDRTVTIAEADAFFHLHVRGRLNGLPHLPVRSAVCVYTSTANASFLIDHTPDDDRIVVASACSGHGFKHSPAVGEHISELVQGVAQVKPEFRFQT